MCGADLYSDLMILHQFVRDSSENSELVKTARKWKTTCLEILALHVVVTAMCGLQLSPALKWASQPVLAFDCKGHRPQHFRLLRGVATMAFRMSSTITSLKSTLDDLDEFIRLLPGSPVCQVHKEVNAELIRMVRVKSNLSGEVLKDVFSADKVNEDLTQEWLSSAWQHNVRVATIVAKFQQVLKRRKQKPSLLDQLD